MADPTRAAPDYARLLAGQATCKAVPHSSPAATAASATAIAWGLAHAGARVAVAGRSARQGRSARGIAARRRPRRDRRRDGRARDGRRSAPPSTPSAARFGGLDILVNCVGIQREERLAEVTEAASTRSAGQPEGGDVPRPGGRAAPGRGRRGGASGSGRQVHLLSVRSQLGMRGRGYSAYCATKGALVMLVKQHAVELAPHGITVNGVAPTVVRSEMGAHWLADPATRGHAARAHPARPRRRARGRRRRGAVLLQPGGGLRHRPGALRRRRHDRDPVIAPTGLSGPNARARTR